MQGHLSGSDGQYLVALSFMFEKTVQMLQRIQDSLLPVKISESASRMRVQGIAADGAVAGGMYAFNADEGGFCVVCSGGGRTLP